MTIEREAATLGFYGERILPRIINAACGMKAAEPLRQRVCQGMEGDIVEIGFGSGLNIPFYPPTVSRVAAVEPSAVGWKLASKRLRATEIPVQWSGTDGQALPFPNACYDAAILDVFYEKGAPKALAATSLGIAVSP